MNVKIEELSISNSNNIDEIEILLRKFFIHNDYSKRTQVNYRSYICNFFFFTNKEIDEINYDDIINWKEYLKNRDIKNNALKTMISALKSFFNWLYISKKILNNPLEYIKTPKKEESKTKSLTKEEVSIILNNIENLRDLCIVSLMLNGLRPIETLQLKIKHYNKEEKTILVENSKNRKNSIVPLFSWVNNNLINYIESKEQIKDEDYIFVSFKKEEPLTYKAIQYIIEILRNRTNIEFTAHQFRHTFATNLLEEGFSPFHLQTLMRHECPSTLRIYTKSANKNIAIKEFRSFENDRTIF